MLTMLVLRKLRLWDVHGDRMEKRSTRPPGRGKFDMAVWCRCCFFRRVSHCPESFLLSNGCGLEPGFSAADQQAGLRWRLAIGCYGLLSSLSLRPWDWQGAMVKWWLNLRSSTMWAVRQVLESFVEVWASSCCLRCAGGPHKARGASDIWALSRLRTIMAELFYWNSHLKAHDLGAGEPDPPQFDADGLFKGSRLGFRADDPA